MAKVIGIGGVFFKSSNPAKLAGWYEKWLHVYAEPNYSVSFRPDTLPPGAFAVLAPFRKTTDYFDPSDKPFMFNLIVDDLEGALAQVRKGGAEVMEKIEESSYGRFGWFIDPDGNKVELWVPPEENLAGKAEKRPQE